MSVSANDFKDVMAQVATTVTVVTAKSSDGPIGLTVSAFTSVSVDPPIVLVCIDKVVGTIEAMLEAPGFTVNMMPEDSEDEAMLFATHGTDRFGSTKWQDARSPEAGPVLASAFAYFACATVKRTEIGDHWVIFGEVTAVGLPKDGSMPLVWHDRGFAKVAR